MCKMRYLLRDVQNKDEGENENGKEWKRAFTKRV